MCLISFSPSGIIIPENHIRTAWNNGNNDGAGYAFVADGRLIVRKPFWKLGKLIRSYQSDSKDNPNSPFLLHLRLATDGGKNRKNTHPFSLANDSVVLAHNGILSLYSGHKTISDTRLFCETVLVDRPGSQLTGKPFNSILAKMIGQGNKLVLLGNDGRYSIVNESCGNWNDGIWYSNENYKERIGYGGYYSGYRWERNGKQYRYDDETGVLRVENQNVPLAADYETCLMCQEQFFDHEMMSNGLCPKCYEIYREDWVSYHCDDEPELRCQFCNLDLDECVCGDINND